MAELEERAVQDGAKSLSDWARKQLLEDPALSSAAAGTAADAGSARDEGESGASTSTAPPLGRSWAEEWAYLEGLTEQTAQVRFVELAAGRSLPDGFRGWRKEDKIAWLDQNWRLD